MKFSQICQWQRRCNKVAPLTWPRLQRLLKTSHFPTCPSTIGCNHFNSRSLMVFHVDGCQLRSDTVGTEREIKERASLNLIWAPQMKQYMHLPWILHVGAEFTTLPWIGTPISLHARQHSPFPPRSVFIPLIYATYNTYQRRGRNGIWKTEGGAVTRRWWRDCQVFGGEGNRKRWGFGAKVSGDSRRWAVTAGDGTCQQKMGSDSRIWAMTA